MQIIVTGSLSFDHIMNFPDRFEEHIMPDKLHALSVSFLVNTFNKSYGGVAGNISYNLGLLGHRPTCLACMGKDGGEYKAFLKKNGVRVRHIKLAAKELTATFFVITDKNDCQIAGFFPGAMKEDVLLDINDASAGSSKPFVVIAPTMSEAMRNFIRQAKERQIRYLFAPAQQIPRLSKQVLLDGIRGAEILLGNDYEIALTCKKTGLTKSQILAKVKALVTTLGEKGSQIEQKGNRKIRVDVVKPKYVKDPTGAGDAYIAGFLSSYLANKSLRESAQQGATAAVYAIEKYGTTAHSYTLKSFKRRQKTCFG